MEQIYYFEHEKSNSEYIVRIEQIYNEKTARLLIFKGKTPFGEIKYNEIDDKAVFYMNFFKEFAKEIPEDKTVLKQAFDYLELDNEIR